MELFLTRRFISRFEKLPQAVRSQVRAALDEITQDPYQGKRLSGSLEGDFSWRSGRYRIIYSISGSRVFAETVGHRKDVYRRVR